MGLRDALSPRRRRERERRAERAAAADAAAAQREAEELAAGAAAFARWHAAADAVRSELSTPDAHFLLDVLALPVVAMEADGGWHREGPVPPPAVLGAVFAALGARPADAALAELYAADVDVLAQRAWPRGDAAAPAALRAAARARVPHLQVLPHLARHPAHARAAELLAAIGARVNASTQDELRIPALRFTGDGALGSARWWPGRGTRDLPREVARLTDPLRLAYVGRGMAEHRVTADAYDAMGDANRVARGEGLPPVEPVQWLLSALRYRAGTLRGE